MEQSGSTVVPAPATAMDTSETNPPAEPTQFALPHAKAIDLIGEEFVPRLKTEPEEGSSGTESLQRPTVVMSVATASQPQPAVSNPADQTNLVYCNLNDLDFSTAGEGGAFTTLSSLTGHTSVMSDSQLTASTSGQLLQMVQAVPGTQTTDKNPYSAVSTILLQGGILQLKSDSTASVSNIVNNNPVGGAGELAQVLHLPVDSKLPTGQERMLPGQQIVTTTNGGGRPQDAIASILASMNSGSAGGTIIQAVEDPLAGPGQEVVSVVSGLGGEERTEVVPLNLATSSAGAVQVQGFKRVAAGQSGSLVTKKVIIATINGTQRILTPVSNPQMIAVKSSGGTRLMADPSGGGGTPLTIIQQKPVLQQKPSVIASPGAVSSSAASQAAKSVDNKTCRWKFENGQICGKVFTKTYNLTVHMRMHQDIRPFPCTICEQTFRQKAHLQRHEATHGIDSTQGKKRRKKSLLDGQLEGGGGLLGARRPGARMSESEEEDGEPGAADYRGFDGKRERGGGRRAGRC